MGKTRRELEDEKIKEQYEDFNEQLIDFIETLGNNKGLIKTPIMEKFYNRSLVAIEWLQLEIEEEIEEV